MQPFYKSVLLTFVAGVVLTSILEYITGWLLETLFHLKLWDYSERLFKYQWTCVPEKLLDVWNIGGRYSVLYPSLVFEADSRNSPRMDDPADRVFTGTFNCRSCCYNLYCSKNERAVKTDASYGEELYAKAEVLRAELSENTRRFGEGVQKQMEERREQLSDRLAHLKEKSKNLTYDRPKLLEKRILRAFPHMRQTRYPEALDKLKKTLSSRKKKQ